MNDDRHGVIDAATRQHLGKPLADCTMSDLDALVATLSGGAERLRTDLAEHCQKTGTVPPTITDIATVDALTGDQVDVSIGVQPGGMPLVLLRTTDSTDGTASVVTAVLTGEEAARVAAALADAANRATGVLN
ncbi:hypothetical protein FF36_05336 [Frankia torreyi]|uniref:Uncharacterized protein n=1 Tax=Frankia torreyi TaxID=1856 RepID=A0A0D8BAH2_9ACTN|nr:MULTISPECIES: hypothetical protein [Frankia]KJE20362.1 hypothetical protein FF36_05336 [Frankia torreyi]KQM02734.1 hypothetical protein FF86_105726 [Frankia sp. CpI1-P]